MILAVTVKSMLDYLDLELQAKEGAGLLPGVRVAPGKCTIINHVQVRERFWLH